MIYEPTNSLYINTPQGKGRVWLVTQFGMETQLLLTVILNKSGEIWEFTNAQVTVDPNPTIEGFNIESPHKVIYDGKCGTPGCRVCDV